MTESDLDELEQRFQTPPFAHLKHELLPLIALSRFVHKVAAWDYEDPLITIEKWVDEAKALIAQEQK